VGSALLPLTASLLALLQPPPDPVTTERPPATVRAIRIVPRCEAEDNSAIVVCGRRDPDRYRLPLRDEGFDPNGPLESVARERNRLMEGGETGIGSCSNVGPGGWTGCFAIAVKHRQQQSAGR